LGAIPVNQTLQHLDLERSYDDTHEPSITKVLAEVLVQNRSVTMLCLGGNRIQDTGATQLAQLLKASCTLKHLRLEANNVDVLGAQAIAAVLPYNSGLQTVSFNANPLTENDGKFALIEAIPHNISLLHMSLRPLSAGRYSSVIADHARLESRFATSADFRVCLRLLMRRLVIELLPGPTTIVLSYLWNSPARDLFRMFGLEQRQQPERNVM
jgi:hypothetical protein